MASKRSIVEYFGLGEGHRCGYCGNTDTSISHGLWAHQMTCRDYEDLIDRGWRRSGKYVYKPLMNVTCCPMYTIRCDATKIKLSKSQKKVLKRMNKFLINGEVEDSPNKCETSDKQTNTLASDTPKDVESTKFVEGENKEVTKNANESEDKEYDESHGDLKDKEAAARSKMKPIKHQVTGEIKKPNQKHFARSLEDFFDELKDTLEVKHKLEVKLCKVDSMDDQCTVNFQESFKVFCKYQETVHKDPKQKLNVNRIKTVRSHPESNEFKKNVASEYELFLKYQMDIHKESESENSMSQFKRFLVSSPLIAEEGKAGLPHMGLGAFHQQYYLDDQLIAVGVIDILPHGVSSKYFFYDPAYSFLSLGTYSALREIYFVRRLQEDCANLKYYYMGYYIHSCQKMRYKGNYDPSFLLCPEAYTFQPIKNCLEKFSSSKYSRLAPKSENPDDESNYDVNKALILHDGQAMRFQLYMDVFLTSESDRQREMKVVQEYCLLSGVASENMLLYRN